MSTESSGYHERAPHPALRPFVVCTWSDFSGPATGAVLPDGCIDVVWAGDDVVVAGPDTGPVLVTSGGSAGIRFRPGAAPAFLGVPASELRDRRVPLAALWGLAQVPAPSLVAIESALLRRLPAAGIVDEGVLSAARALQRGSRPVATIAGELDVDVRVLLRRFSAAVGYGPKTLDRVLRFQRALRLGWAGVPLARLAAEAGYADQAHLSREVRRMAGTTPSELFKPSERFEPGRHGDACGRVRVA